VNGKFDSPDLGRSRPAQGGMSVLVFSYFGIGCAAVGRGGTLNQLKTVLRHPP
jgi:hypothetical protein